MNILDEFGDVLLSVSDIIYSLSSGWLSGEEEPPTVYTEEVD